MNISKAARWTLLLLVSAGCGSDGKAPGNPSTATCTDYATAICQAACDCAVSSCRVRFSSGSSQNFGSTAACEQAFSESCRADENPEIDVCLGEFDASACVDATGGMAISLPASCFD